MPGVPDRRARVLNFIRDFISDNGYPPTVREIQKACGFAATAPAQYQLSALEREGLIKRTPRISRGIRLVQPDQFLEESNRSGS